ncbi:MAG: hypothetical protein AAGA06_07615 [Pseudomonadota bacterium]
MFKIPAAKLAKKSDRFRYLYFVITSCKLKSFKAWRQAGEPNPFVQKTYRHNVTARVEFTDIFDDILKPDRTESRDRA